MLRPSSVTRLLALHTLSPSSTFRTCDALSVLRRYTPPTQYPTRRLVATATTETTDAQHSVLIHAPALKDIEALEYDVELIPPEELQLGITRKAAEVRFRLSSTPGPSLVTSQFTSVPLLGARADGRLFYKATTGDFATTEEPQGSSEGNHRVWRVSRVPI